MNRQREHQVMELARTATRPQCDFVALKAREQLVLLSLHADRAKELDTLLDDIARILCDDENSAADCVDLIGDVLAKTGRRPEDYAETTRPV